MHDADSDGSGDADPDIDDEKYKSLAGGFDNVEIGPIAVGPDGVPAVGVGATAPVPAADPRLFICLRGPCAHYWERESFMESGNPKETWEDMIDPATGARVRMPRQLDRTCTAHPGTETDLTDQLVYDCNRWEPLTRGELKARDKRRRHYFKNYPDHQPIDVPADRLRGSSHARPSRSES